MGDANGSPQPTPQPSPSPVLDLLKSLGSGALAVPKAIGGGLSDVLTGEGGSDRTAMQQIGRLLATLAVGENMGAQFGMRKDWAGQDSLYRGAPDSDLYRSVVEQGLAAGGDPQKNLDRVYGSGAVPPFSSLKLEQPGPEGPSVRNGMPIWGGATTETRQDELGMQRGLDYMSKLERDGFLLGHTVEVDLDKSGNPIAKMKSREQPSFDASKVDFEFLKKNGFRATAPVPFGDKLGVHFEYIPGAEAYSKSLNTSLGKMTAASTPLGGTTIDPAAVGKTSADLESERKLADATAKVKLRTSTLTPAQKDQLTAMDASETWLTEYLDYTQNGQKADPSQNLDRIPSALSPTRVSGLSALAPMAKTNETILEFDRDPFFQGMQRRLVEGRSFLTRALHGEKGRTPGQLEVALGKLLKVYSKPEAVDMVSQLRTSIVQRREAILKGKLTAGIVDSGKTAEEPEAAARRQRLMEKYAPR